MFRTMIAAAVLVSVACLGSCSSDDPADPGGGNGGGGDPGAGVAYQILPFDVVRHGVSLSGVWTDGDVTVTVGTKGRAFIQSAAGRFILPVNEDYDSSTLTGVSSTGMGRTYMTGAYHGGFNRDSPPIFRFENGLCYTETVDENSGGTSIYCGSPTMTYLTVRQELWLSSSGIWDLQHEFDDICNDLFHGGSSRIFVACNDGLYAFDGATWENAYPTAIGVHAVDGLDEDQVMAISFSDIIINDAGSAFELAYNAGVRLEDIDWAAEDWTVAVGWDGTVVMHDGIGWTRLQVDYPGALKDVAAWKDGERGRAVAVGLAGAEYRYADGSWTGSYLPAGYWQDLAGDGQGNLFGIYTGTPYDEPEETIFYRFDGTTWEDDPYPGDLVLSRLFCRDAGAIWAIGRRDIDNFIARYDGSAWTASWLASLETARDLWVSDDNQTYVACDHGTVYVNSAPETAVQPLQHLTGIWGVSAADVFVVGESGAISRRQESTWTPMNSGATSHLNAIDGASADHVVAVGDGGVVLRLTAGAWSTMNPGFDADLDMVWTDSAQNIWVAASAEDLVAHYDGNSWAVFQTSVLRAGPRAVWSDGNDVWVSAGSMLLRYAEPPSFAAVLGTP